MSETFSINQGGKGRFKIQVVEREICREVRRKAVAELGIADGFRSLHGRNFSGSGDDLCLLAPAERQLVDAAVVASILAEPEAWNTSPEHLIEDRAEQPNLILNQGLNNLASRACTWETFGGYCSLGTGTSTPAVTQTGLDTQVVRTNTLLGGLGTTDDNATRTRTYSRTFDFPAEVSNQNYTEVGVSHAASGATSLNTRALISGGTVTVLVGQQARITYDISVTLAASFVFTPPATGWPVSPATTVQATAAYCTLNAVTNFHNNSSLLICAGSTIPAFGTSFSTGGSAQASTSGFNAYTAGTFKSVRWARWELGAGNGTTWRSFVPETYPISNSFAVVFDQAQTKDNLHTLTITWSITFGRA